MTDVDKQASQRTVVAFISGLLIGGLLVWVFSPAPENTKKTENGNATTTEQTDGTKDTPTTGDTTASQTQAQGSLKVDDQAAGTHVSLAGTTFPAEKGWIVVRDHQEGVAGGILGAARYDTTTGLKPTSVELLRATVAGNTYEALFYSDAGAATFDLSEDAPVANSGATFKAQ